MSTNRVRPVPSGRTFQIPGTNALAVANEIKKTMEDLKGLRLRSPTRLAGDALNALGAIGRPMPIPQLPEALAQKALDGCVIPWEVVPAVKVIGKRPLIVPPAAGVIVPSVAESSTCVPSITG